MRASISISISLLALLDASLAPSAVMAQGTASASAAASATSTSSSTLHMHFNSGSFIQCGTVTAVIDGGVPPFVIYAVYGDFASGQYKFWNEYTLGAHVLQMNMAAGTSFYWRITDATNYYADTSYFTVQATTDVNGGNCLAASSTSPVPSSNTVVYTPVPSSLSSNRSISSTPGLITTPTSTPTPSPTPQNSSTNIGAIAGGVAGGLAVLALIAAALFFGCRRKWKDVPPKTGFNGAAEHNGSGGGSAAAAFAAGAADGPSTPKPEMDNERDGPTTNSYPYLTYSNSTAPTTNQAMSAVPNPNPVSWYDPSINSGNNADGGYLDPRFSGNGNSEFVAPSANQPPPHQGLGAGGLHSPGFAAAAGAAFMGGASRPLSNNNIAAAHQYQHQHPQQFSNAVAAFNAQDDRRFSMSQSGGQNVAPHDRHDAHSTPDANNVGFDAQQAHQLPPPLNRPQPQWTNPDSVAPPSTPGSVSSGPIPMFTPAPPLQDVKVPFGYTGNSSAADSYTSYDPSLGQSSGSGSGSGSGGPSNIHPSSMLSGSNVSGAPSSGGGRLSTGTGSQSGSAYDSGLSSTGFAGAALGPGSRPLPFPPSLQQRPEAGPGMGMGSVGGNSNSNSNSHRQDIVGDAESHMGENPPPAYFPDSMTSYDGDGGHGRS